MPRKLLLFSVMLLTGCATMGESDYACKGRPGKPLCRSTTEIYERTHNQEALIRIEHEESEAKPSIKSSMREIYQSKVSDTETLIPQPTIPVEDTLPIRTPAKVMRIWIAPWEDEEGDLIASGYIYTEIESRRWQIGIDKVNSNFRTLEPLKSNISKLEPSRGTSGRVSPGNRPQSKQFKR